MTVLLTESLSIIISDLTMETISNVSTARKVAYAAEQDVASCVLPQSCYLLGSGPASQSGSLLKRSEVKITQPGDPAAPAPARGNS